MKKNKWFIVFLITFSLFLLSFFRIDPDYLWHIKAGEYMFNNGIIRHDVFSWSVNSYYWMSHEWLFEIIIYSLKFVFGKLHLLVYCFSCVFLLLLSIYIGNKDRINNNHLFGVVWIFISIIFSFVMQGRPHLISFCLLSVTIYFLYDLYKNEDSKKIYFLPLISIIWANVHGGSSNLPYLLCIIFMIAGAFKFKFSKIEAIRLNKKQYSKYIVVTLLCMVAVCINIHGFKMFLYPYENMLDTTMLNNITEWRSTSLNELTHYVYYGLLVFIACIMLFSKKKIEFMDFILFGFCAYLGLKSIRFWFYTYIIMSYIVFYYIPKRKEDQGFSLALGIVSCVLIILFATRCSSIINYKNYYLLNDKDISAIKEANPSRLFNMYNYGGELIYHDILVFIDGRADLYGKHNYKDYLKISKLNDNYEELIAKYDFDYFLVDKKYPINRFLDKNEEYECIYNRDKVLLYKKRTA